MTVIISNAEVGGVAGCTVVVDEISVTVLPEHHQVSPDTSAPGSDVTLLDARGGGSSAGAVGSPRTSAFSRSPRQIP